jgi:hypothetical protein
MWFQDSDPFSSTSSSGELSLSKGPKSPARERSDTGGSSGLDKISDSVQQSLCTEK